MFLSFLPRVLFPAVPLNTSTPQKFHNFQLPHIPKMAVTTVSIALGTFMAICAATSIILNLLVIYTIVLGGFLRARENSIYILSLLNLVIDCAHATFVFVYLVPSSIAQV
jgi:hypothetical protein